MSKKLSLMKYSRKAILPSLMFSASVAISLLGHSAPVVAGNLPKVAFGTDWFAQAQHGGYYQAIAIGIYKKYGLDVKVDMGGPGINGQQLLVAGRYQFFMGNALDNLVATAHGLPLVTVATIFQKSPTCIYAHKWATTPESLDKASQILVSSNEIHSWWPWAMTKFGYKANQRGVYTGSVAPFIADKNIAQQGYYGAEGYTFGKEGVKYKTFLLADYGYPEYSETIETTATMVKDHPEIVKKFIEATMLGWKSYLANPAPGNKLIIEANPKQTPGQLAFGVSSMIKGHMLTGPATVKGGIGTMTNARWKKIFDIAVKNGLVPATMDYHKSYTLQFVKKTNVHLK